MVYENYFITLQRAIYIRLFSKQKEDMGWEVL